MLPIADAILQEVFPEKQLAMVRTGATNGDVVVSTSDVNESESSRRDDSKLLCKATCARLSTHVPMTHIRESREQQKKKKAKNKYLRYV